jgi:CxxC motif-containing protein
MEMICIACPNGCRLTVETTRSGLVVRGNTCAKGEEYGREEATDPRRVVRTSDPHWPYVPVRTDKAIPKKLIPKLLRELCACRAKLPVKRGKPLVRDYEGTGASVVFTRTLPPPRRRKRT